MFAYFEMMYIFKANFTGLTGMWSLGVSGSLVRVLSWCARGPGFESPLRLIFLWPYFLKSISFYFLSMSIMYKCMHVFIKWMLYPVYQLVDINRYGKGNKPVHLYSLRTPQDQKIETALEAAIQPVCKTTTVIPIHDIYKLSCKYHYMNHACDSNSIFS